MARAFRTNFSIPDDTVISIPDYTVLNGRRSQRHSHFVYCWRRGSSTTSSGADIAEATFRTATVAPSLGEAIAAQTGCFYLENWCCQTGLNCRPLHYQWSALPLSYGSVPGYENRPKRAPPRRPLPATRAPRA